MKKLIQGIMFTCAAVTTPVMAQTVNYACQYVDRGGLNWKNGQWIVGRFPTPQPFILTARDGRLVPPEITSDQQFSHPLAFAKCREPGDEVTGISDGKPVETRVQLCDNGGSVLVFSFANLTGTYSDLLGGAGARNGNYKDSLTVAPFVCETIR